MCFLSLTPHWITQVLEHGHKIFWHSLPSFLFISTSGVDKKGVTSPSTPPLPLDSQLLPHIVWAPESSMMIMPVISSKKKGIFWFCIPFSKVCPLRICLQENRCGNSVRLLSSPPSLYDVLSYMVKRHQQVMAASSSSCMKWCIPQKHCTEMKTLNAPSEQRRVA